MLKIEEVRRSSKPLGLVVGKETSARLLETRDLDKADVYVKYGRQLLKVQNLNVGWNGTVFDSALNHPLLGAWTVSKDLGGGFKILAAKKKGLQSFEEKSETGGKISGEELTEDDCTVLYFVKNKNQDFVMTLDDVKMPNSYKLSTKSGRITLSFDTSLSTSGEKIRPVLRSDGSTAYLATESALYQLDSEKLSSKKIPIASIHVEKVFNTNANEIVVIFPQGLQVYSVSAQSTNINYYCPMFSSLEGWTERFVDSVQLLKIDNQDALIGSGPKGIEYFPLSKNCKSYAVQDSDVSKIQAKYAQVVAASSKGNDKIQVLGYYNGELQLITLKVENIPESKPKEDPKDNKKPERIRISKSSKLQVSSQEKTPKPTRWMRDDIDESSFKNIVDKLTGKLQFSFPLINLQDRMNLPIKLMAYYEEADSEDMSVLGRHWTLGKDCIVLDHGGTVFEDKHSYYLVKDQMKINLERNWSERGQGNKLQFHIQGHKNVTLEYDRTNEQWTAKNSKVTYVYGKRGEGVVTVPAWSDWYGASAKFGQDRNHVVQWNLVEIKSGVSEDLKISYKYNAIDPTSNMLHLQSISDNAYTVIKFRYKDVNLSKPQVETDAAKEHKFINNKLLENIEINTPNYAQTLKITSKQIDAQYYLENIKQDGDDTPILSFEYNKEDPLKPRVNQIKLPSRSVLDFSYIKQTVETNQFIREIPKLADFHTGPGYSLQIKKDAEEAYNLHITTRDSSGWNNFVKEEQFEILSFSGKKIKSYNPYMQQSYFAIVVNYEGDISKIHIYNKLQGKDWKYEEVKGDDRRYGQDKQFRVDFHEDSFSYYASQKINFEYKKSDSTDWTHVAQSIDKPELISLFKKGAVYFASTVDLVRLDPLGNTKKTTLSDPSDIPNPKDLESFFTHIELSGSDPSNEQEASKEVEDYKKELTEMFNNNGLTVYNNLVAMRTAKLDPSGETKLKIYLYLLNKDYAVSQKSVIDLTGEDLTKFSLTMDVFDEGKSQNVNQLDKYRFEFRKEGDKFKVKFISATDYRGQATSPSSKNNEAIPFYERKMKIPLDFEKYMMQVSPDGIIVGNQKIFHSDGKFIAQSADREALKLTRFSIPLGDYSTFRKDADHEDVKICTKQKQGSSESCVSLGINVARNVSVKYPYYLVGQQRNDIVVLPLKLNSRGTENKVEYRNEILHGSTSHFALVTTRTTDSSTIVRPLKSLNKDGTIEAQVITQEKLTTPHEVYQINYEYSRPVPSSNGITFQTTLVVPGGKKEVTGYYNETTDLQANKQVVSVMTSKGELFDPEYVKRMNEMKEEEEKQQDQPSIDGDATIFDKSEMHPIVKTTPYSKDQNLVHFVGFEDYEDLTGWNFNTNQIWRNTFAGTGRNYLELKSGQELFKQINGVSYYEPFVASSWIRTTQEVALSSSTQMISIQLNRKTIQGTIKQRIGEWIYVEATTKSNRPETRDKPRKVNVKITIKPAGTSEIHVDHVRISPINFNFEANVYDSTLGQRTALISTNGKASYRLYDYHNRRVGEVSENGFVKFLASYSKRFQAKTSSQPKAHRISRVQMRPKRGWLETFSPFSVDDRWNFNSTYSAKPGVLLLTGKATYKHKFSSDSIGVRMIYSVPYTSDLSIQIAKAFISLKAKTLTCGSTYVNVPERGELILLHTPRLLTIWLDGNIVHETIFPAESFTNETLILHSTGQVEIKDLVVMEDTETQVSYLNREMKPIQEILLQDSENILLQQTIYDSIDRKVAETVWTKLPIDGYTTFQYHEDFITNEKSFLQTGVMNGKVATGNSMYDNYPFSQTEYYNNPLEIRQTVGSPGQGYSIKGKFRHEYKIESDLPFIQRHYPKEQGFRQEQEKQSNTKTHVVVYNRRNKKVAEYTQVTDHNNILTTWAYNGRGNELQMLPPSYYAEKAKNNSQSRGFEPESNVIQTPWAVNLTYDASGDFVTSKTTPDGGRVDFIYNELDQLRYQLHYGENNQVDKIVYYLYNSAGKVCEAGKLKASRETEAIARRNDKSYSEIPNRDYAIYIDYGETDPNPALRGRIQRVVKKNDKVHFDEVLFFDEDGNMVGKSYLSPKSNETLSVEYLYENDKIGGIRYPFEVDGEQLILKFDHNLRGEVTKVSRMKGGSSEQVIVELDHDAQGKVLQIKHKYGFSPYDQQYVYKAPGYLYEIKNPFLNETLYYTNKGYGAEPTGDGSILRTEFHAGWHDRCDQNLIPLTARAFVSERINFKVAELCFDALLSLGYFDGMGRPVKTYYLDVGKSVPKECSEAKNWRDISTNILERGFPQDYGHAYDYGTHGELIAAKHFVGDEKDRLKPPPKGNKSSTPSEPTALGNSPGDVESFSIDPNGNHRLYYTGFRRFELNYKPFKNQIASIKKGFTDEFLEILHDSEGNIVKALHKNIDKIEYDPLTKRVSRIELVKKSRILEFGYDFRGERTLKRVRNKDNQLLSEIYYVRDNKGNTLVEYKQQYPNPGIPTKAISTVTAYIHGPIGLLGFFRNNKYYSVLLDHEGSTRLVLHNGQVVAAYDYLPYGQLMRTFGFNSEAHIAYRYTGQEFDEETGLYNYHARLYDPDIGRFFQMDPMEQYASPYKYAGNSPVTQIDPDGQIAITLIAMIIGALVGAYMGAAQANNSWDPAKWAWADKKTWIGMFAGAAMGAFAVSGGVASFGYFASMFGGSMLAAGLATGAISVAGAFLGAAAAANEWDPAKWDWSSPAVWNGFLTGISIGVSFPSGFVGITRTFMSFTMNTWKVVYAASMASGFLLLLYVGASMANNFNFRLDTWDWKSPRTWFGMLEGVSTLFMGTSAGVRHGAIRTHYIVQPSKMKLAWYNINIPARSFTVKQIGSQYVLTWYKYGNRMGIQYIKSQASLLKYIKPVVGFTDAFFISHFQRFKSVLAMGLFGGVHYINFKSYFEHEPNATETTEATEEPQRRRRSAGSVTSAAGSVTSAAGSVTSAAGSVTSAAGGPWGFLNDLINAAVGNIWNESDQMSSTKSFKGIRPFDPLTKPKLDARSYEKFCYSPNDTNDHVICPQWDSTVKVFFKHQDFDEDTFGKDQFTRCSPMYWHDQPSVTCEGEQSTFVYTPRQTARVFDMVDGWLLLARVTPAAVRNLKSGFSFLRNALFGTEDRCPKVQRLAQQKLDLSKELKIIKKLMDNSKTDSSWAKPIFADLEDDIVEFGAKTNPAKSELMLLQERLDSLREDLMETECQTPFNPDLNTMLEQLTNQIHRQQTDLGGLVKLMYSSNIPESNKNYPLLS